MSNTHTDEALKPLQKLKKQRDEVEAWLLKKRCTCLDIRGENPECLPCDALDLIDRLFEIAEKGASTPQEARPSVHGMRSAAEWRKEIFNNTLAGQVFTWAEMERIVDRIQQEALQSAGAQEGGTVGGELATELKRLLTPIGDKEVGYLSASYGDMGAWVYQNRDALLAALENDRKKSGGPVGGEQYDIFIKAFRGSTKGSLNAGLKKRIMRGLDAIALSRTSAPDAKPLSDWHEDMGPMLWWKFPVCEPPFCGTPLDGDWPGYHTHFTRIVVPAATEKIG